MRFKYLILATILSVSATAVAAQDNEINRKFICTHDDFLKERCGFLSVPMTIGETINLGRNEYERELIAQQLYEHISTDEDFVLPPGQSIFFD